MWISEAWTIRNTQGLTASGPFFRAALDEAMALYKIREVSGVGIVRAEGRVAWALDGLNRTVEAAVHYEHLLEYLVNRIGRSRDSETVHRNLVRYVSMLRCVGRNEAAAGAEARFGPNISGPNSGEPVTRRA